MIKKLKYADFIVRDYLTNSDRAQGIAGVVADILADVSRRGDEALFEYGKRFDNCELSSLEVTDEEIKAATEMAGAEFLGVMERAARNIEEFHRRQVRYGYVMNRESGVTLGQLILPLERVGLYIPGGTAVYPSTVLMNCIPAKLAGVKELILTTPPSPDGSVDSGIMAAAKLAGADRIFKVGGAQAIAAMAFGTQTVPRVDKIVGPGNEYVAEAKRQVFGITGIDIIAGPSDICIIADEASADAALIAADMLSQCEHGKTSRAVLATNSSGLAERVGVEIEAQLKDLPRYEMARAAIDNNSVIVITNSIEQAFDVSNELAPEHLEIFLNSPFDWLYKVKNAGSVFLGKHTPEALGDYYAGTNHTLPTSGTARFSSPLSVDDFTKKTSFTYYSEDALAAAASDVATFAEREGLRAHALSILKRTDEGMK
ncbi:MAG: histidinol dehydrogenase [Oscillospiraceae bacterium]|nr:histidinol dehydrogenase [Oscillospiraceae bacterium]